MDKIQTLFEGTDLSQEFKDKAVAIVESMIAEKETTLTEEIEAKYQQISEDYAQYVVSEMEEKTEAYIQEEVIPMVEKYLDYSVKEFMTENQLAVESGTKVALAEQFLSGMSQIAEQFNVVVPEGKDDYITEMQTKLDAMEARFDAVLSEKAELEQELTESKMVTIVDAKVADLTESQKEKFYATAAKVSFKSEDQYKAAIDELFESYFPAKGEQLKEDVQPEVITEQKGSTYFDQLLSRI